MKPLDLIATARRLTTPERSYKPGQAALRRAVSAAYYAMFHTLCHATADLLVGTEKSNRSDGAWVQAYRAVEHRFAKNQCKNQTIIGKFPKEIEDFAGQFIELQLKRHLADYDPTAHFTMTDTQNLISTAELAIRSFNACRPRDKRAFAVWVTMKARAD